MTPIVGDGNMLSPIVGDNLSPLASRVAPAREAGSAGGAEVPKAW